MTKTKDMKIYFACPTGKRRDSIVEDYGSRFGACLTRDVFNNITANKMPWFLDNGAFADWKNGDENINNIKFLNRLDQIKEKVEQGILTMPDFVVVPDLVARGEDSLVRSSNWIQTFKEDYPGFKFYVAAQDGMRFHYNQDGTKSARCIEVALKSNQYDGLFIGGTKEWKYKNSEELIQMANKCNLPSHIGGIGNRKPTLWAKSIGAASVDSGVAMIHPKHLKEILGLHNEMAWTMAA